MNRAQLVVYSDVATTQPVVQGNLLDFPEDPIRVMRRLWEVSNEIAAFEQESQRLHFVFSPQYNHQVLSDSANFHSRFFAIRGGRNSAQRRLTSGLLSMNGDQHKRGRRMVMDAFSKKAINLYIPTVAQLTQDMLAKWEPGREVDINHEMTEFMLRVTSSILFGVDNPEMAYRVGRMTDHWVQLNHELGMGALVSSPEITQRYDEILEYSNGLEAEIRAMIDLRRQSAGMGRDALSMLLAAHDGEGAISDPELVGHTALLFAASHLTTAHTFAWTLFLLSQHVPVMQELHREIAASSGSTGEEPLPFTERVIKESMRCLPASAYSQRVATAPVELGPFQLQPGAVVIFSQFMTHHREDLYPEADRFIPDRWASINPSPYAYLPFGAGPRMCIGAALGMLILKTALPMILRQYKLTAVPYSEVCGKVISTMLSPTAPIRMVMDRQDGRFECHPVRGNIHELVELPMTQRVAGLHVA